MPRADIARGRPEAEIAPPPTATSGVSGGKPSMLAAAWRSLAAMSATMAFRQASMSVAALVTAGALVMWLLYGAVNDIIARQVVETMTVEAEGLAGIARAAGPQALADAIAARVTAEAAAPSGRIYVLQSSAGVKLGGNLERWPAEFPVNARGATFHVPAVGQGAARFAAGVATALPGDMRLLVARDLASQRELASRVNWLFGLGFGALTLGGLIAGLLASRMALRRIADITRTSDAIMAGDFSGRIAVSQADDELDQLSRNLNAMLDKVEQLMGGLREVSDNIAHDLKTPLSRLRTRAEAALRDNAGPERHRQALGEVIEDADELIKTFNALLLIARLEAGTLAETAETFDLSELVANVAELYEPVAEEAGLALTCAVAQGIPLHANRHLMGQAIANLIDNAIKYGQPDSPPQRGGVRGEEKSGDRNSEQTTRARIDVSVRREGDQALVAVGDHGPGIPAADRERVLKRFVRLDASRTKPGTGLGLSLVAAVVRLQGGRIRLEDNAPGLRIVLMLPHARTGSD